MTKANIIVAFPTKKDIVLITNILKENGIVYNCVANTLSYVKKMCIYYEKGIIICGYRLLDDTIHQIIDDFSSNFKFILVGKNDELSMYDGYNIEKMITPIRKEDIISSIYIYMNYIEEMIKNEQNVMINKAKEILFLKYNMTEEDAHKYIQKMSMKYRKKAIEIAYIIINK